LWLLGTAVFVTAGAFAHEVGGKGASGPALVVGMLAGGVVGNFDSLPVSGRTTGGAPEWIAPLVFRVARRSPVFPVVCCSALFGVDRR
jgi:hypothetical protein